MEKRKTAKGRGLGDKCIAELIGALQKLKAADRLRPLSPGYQRLATASAITIKKLVRMNKDGTLDSKIAEGFAERKKQMRVLGKRFRAGLRKGGAK